ncbi:HIT domain-containing protein [Denitrobaculum tricleocarpae]|uniref:HIT family protein n=1 Tax=Denitrobaculum tricleocarpae TaxID=2591009 RepID=A0A545TKJ0_9PROT|nr:HIT family protein [Denitrobaculum tricleocarpae]TQV77744.1 HIT family protein [Denitrobaculum tricleocarpae]
MTEAFELHPKLAADTFAITTWPLCEVRVINDANYPWLVLVPRKAGLKDFDDLSPEDMALAGEEIRQASRALRELYRPDKMNVAALGNQVPQLHIHVVARFQGDAAWPNPIWGVVPARPYPDQDDERLVALKEALLGEIEV